MRKINNWLAASIGFVVGILFFGICHLNHDLKIEAKDKNLEFVHSRDSLVIGILLKPYEGTAYYYKMRGIQKGWPESKIDTIETVDTANFIYDHSELVKVE